MLVEPAVSLPQPPRYPAPVAAPLAGPTHSQAPAPPQGFIQPVAPQQVVPSHQYPVQAVAAPVGVPGMPPAVPAFAFDGGAGSYLGVTILAMLVTICSFGICYPFALVLRERWKAEHTLIEGRRLSFHGTGLGLFGNWLKWGFLTIITLGVYAFWVVPKVTKWKVEHLSFGPRI